MNTAGAMQNRHVTVGDIAIGNDLPLVLIAGPCQIETLDHALMMAERIAEASAAAGIPFIYKSSFDKANRSSHQTGRGVGMGNGAGYACRRQAAFRLPGADRCA